MRSYSDQLDYLILIWFRCLERNRAIHSAFRLLIIVFNRLSARRNFSIDHSCAHYDHKIDGIAVNTSMYVCIMWRDPLKWCSNRAPTACRRLKPIWETIDVSTWACILRCRRKLLNWKIVLIYALFSEYSSTNFTSFSFDSDDERADALRWCAQWPILTTKWRANIQQDNCAYI